MASTDETSHSNEISEEMERLQGTWKQIGYERDPTRTPKTVDWTDTTGEDAGKTLLAIYRLEEDVFTFCAAYPGLERPTEFRTRPGQVLRVSRRERA